MHKSKHVLTLLLIVVVAWLVAGCYSVPADSDIPWNEPQGWEGSPQIPGFSD